jgi:hypothetical protein
MKQSRLIAPITLLMPLPQIINLRRPPEVGIAVQVELSPGPSGSSEAKRPRGCGQCRLQRGHHRALRPST